MMSKCKLGWEWSDQNLMSDLEEEQDQARVESLRLVIFWVGEGTEVGSRVSRARAWTEYASEEQTGATYDNLIYASCCVNDAQKPN